MPGPLASGILSLLIPGLGQVLNGRFIRGGLIFTGAFGLLVIGTIGGGAVILLLLPLYAVVVAYDAGKVARGVTPGPSTDDMLNDDDRGSRLRFIVGGLLITAVVLAVLAAIIGVDDPVNPGQLGISAMIGTGVAAGLFRYRWNEFGPIVANAIGTGAIVLVGYFALFFFELDEIAFFGAILIYFLGLVGINRVVERFG